jgi:hypothetical protein
MVVHRCFCSFPNRFSLEGPLFWRWLLLGSAFLGSPISIPAACHITGTLLLAIQRPFTLGRSFNNLRACNHFIALETKSPPYPFLQKTIELLLAVRAIMGAAPRHDHATNRGAALPARLAGSLIDAVFQLKKTPDALGVNVVGNR